MCYWCHCFREAWTSIKAGLYDVVLAVGVEQMGTGLLGGAGGGVGIPKEGLLGSGYNASSIC
jgi:acetyl-CoA acetyltransferase